MEIDTRFVCDKILGKRKMKKKKKKPSKMPCPVVSDHGFQNPEKQTPGCVNARQCRKLCFVCLGQHAILETDAILW